MLWFTSDQHFFHGRIIELNNRPFQSMKQMIDQIVKNYNALIDTSDDVWMLGDFAFYKADGNTERIFNLLNGRKHLVVGNHDCERISRRLDWQSVSANVDIELQPGILAHLSHCPVPFPVNPDVQLHLHGHMHGKKMQCDQNCYDVGVDACEFRPVSADEICTIWKKKINLDPVEHVYNH